MRLYALTVFVGAYLLFFVQPMSGKFLLPWFGGGSGVWASCLVFFQVGLLAGYAYAHGLTRFRPSTQAAVHALLLVVAAVTLSVTPSASWKPSPGENPSIRLWAILLVHLGLPYALLCATAPLVQYWFCRTFPGRSPYGLYAVSNAAAVLALFGYPLLAERHLSRGQQAGAWSWLFLAFVGLCTAVAVLSVRRGADDRQQAHETTERDGGSIVLWFLLPACSSALLLAVTNGLTENVPPTPFLWVVPLAIHLLSFVVCFRTRTPYRRTVVAPATVVAGLALARTLYGGSPSIGAQVATHCTLLLFSCLFLHGELYRVRPPTNRLTFYYLAIAAGGALGGLAVALLAPLAFDSFVELPLLLVVLGALLLWIPWTDAGSRLQHGRARWISALLATGLVAFASHIVSQEAELRSRAVLRARSFYGAQTVYELDADEPRQRRLRLVSGKILHGVQYRHPELSTSPTTYYTVSSGLGLALRSFPLDRSLSVGVIGLGVGTIAAYGNRGDSIRFYEIDPKVIDVAEELFTYLDESKAEVEVVPGDARLNLESEAANEFDVLVLDAFTGDAVPVHLLTLQCFQTYLQHLSPGGVIAVHASSLYLDLPSVLKTLAAELGLAGACIYREEGVDVVGRRSTWVLLSREPLARELLEVATPLDDFATGCSLWTDDHASPLEIIRWGG